MTRPGASAVTPANPDPASVESLLYGALTARQAEEFSGLSKNELWDRMDDGTLRWFWHNDRRMIVRRDLIEHLARLFEAGRGTGPRKASPNPHTKTFPPRRAV